MEQLGAHGNLLGNDPQRLARSPQGCVTCGFNIVEHGDSRQKNAFYWFCCGWAREHGDLPWKNGWLNWRKDGLPRENCDLTSGHGHLPRQNLDVRRENWEWTKGKLEFNYGTWWLNWRKTYLTNKHWDQLHEILPCRFIWIVWPIASHVLQFFLQALISLTKNGDLTALTNKHQDTKGFCLSITISRVRKIVFLLAMEGSSWQSSQPKQDFSHQKIKSKLGPRKIGTQLSKVIHHSVIQPGNATSSFWMLRTEQHHLGDVPVTSLTTKEKLK